MPWDQEAGIRRNKTMKATTALDVDTQQDVIQAGILARSYGTSLEESPALSLGLYRS